MVSKIVALFAKRQQKSDETLWNRHFCFNVAFYECIVYCSSKANSLDCFLVIMMNIKRSTNYLIEILLS